MSSFEHRVTDEEQGMRLDALVATFAAEGVASRSAAVRLIESGQVLVNGEPTVKKRLVLSGDRLQVEISDRTGEPSELEPDPSIPLDIRYEDEHIIVLSKQAGLVCHPSRGHWDGTLANALLAHCGQGHLAEVQGEDRPGIVHRLDQDTSGLMLAAKTDVAAARLQEEIRIRDIDRRYLALVHGHIAPDTGMVDAPIARDVQERTRMKVSDEPDARSAITTFTVLERFDASASDEGYTLIECKLYTGRTHQIRVHMAYIKHPVVGDQLYGRAANAKARNRDRFLKSERGLRRQFLHSYRLSFPHPISEEAMDFHDDLPEDLQSVLDDLAPDSMGRTAAGEEVL
ncbi:MAG: RluA family pseudouridine synthase [Coriobacteriaceae bacterium]|nr:RluA family pseudouridine synthase [Coriobacteriaceae bacterium]